MVASRGGVIAGCSHSRVLVVRVRARGKRKGAVYPGVRAAGGVDQAGERERRGGTFGRVSWSPVLLLLVVGGMCRLVDLSTFRLVDLLGSRRGAADQGWGWFTGGVRRTRRAAGGGGTGERSGWRGWRI